MRVPSPSQLNHLLQCCSDSKALKQGRQVHQQIIVHGFGLDPFITTKLIQMYSDCNDFSSTHNLFDKLPQPNVFAWTAILAFYLRNGMYQDCLRTYHQLRWQGTKPDSYIFPKVIRACTQSLSLEEGIEIHTDIIKFDGELNLQVCNSLIDMYSKFGDVQNARRVFDEMLQKDLLSWNSMISGYVCNGFIDLSIKLLDSMRLNGFEPDLVTWNTIMDAYCRIGLCEEASKIFEHVKEPNIISWTSLISGYSRTGKHEISMRIFRDMMSRGGVIPDPDALSSALSSCKLLGNLRSGRELHGYGIKIQEGLEFYNSAGAVLLTMYSGSGKAQFARNVFEFMDKSDVVTWNAMILGLTHLGMGDSALKCFGEMQLIGVKNSQITLSTILPVCDLNLGKQIHADIVKNGFNSAVPVWNALINMYSKCGCIEDAYTVFTNMGTKDVVSWNTMIGGYGIHGHGRAALELLQEMKKQSSILPNSVTFTSALTACSHAGLVDEGLQLFDSWNQEFNFVPTMDHFGCLVDLLARAGRLVDAMDFIKKMPFNPDKSIWGAILAACRAHQNIEIGKIAAENLFSLEPENPGNYVTLSNIYSRAGRFDDSVRVRKLMEARGLVKVSGCSWIGTEN
ncbi:Pentatricopeptide repeat [Macleaya cordata]|uniref:Pentatricopeptide repeat n=1 Tax=Macleaya cordata TaxID=56857 RepID=A0A200R8L7_MACCD|nr:Pentatricopeptide repeat [Macleaya cordata]